MESFLSVRSGAITEMELVSNLVAHFRGVRHREDAKPGIGVPLSKFEPWIGSLRDLALADDYEPLKGQQLVLLQDKIVIKHYEDTSAHEHLLTVCLSGDIGKFETALQSLRARPLHPSPLQPAACIAARRGHVHMLRLCLDEGANFDDHVCFVAWLGARRNLVFLEFLLAQNCANMQNDPVAVLKRVQYYGEDSMEADWLREHTGKGLEVEKIGGKTRTKLEGTSGGGNLLRRAGDLDPNIGYSNEQLEEWFGDVPW